jgi:hypothetical protein
VRNFIILSLFILQHTTFNSQVVADYSNTEHWVISPKHDTSLHVAYISDTTLMAYADVFYVYPTVFTDKKYKDWNVSIDNEEQRKKTRKVSRLQGSAWSEVGRMYAPYYTQAHLRSYTNLETGGRDALLKAYSDVKKAFEFYLENYNQGRPIILAGHSQGATHVMLLLKDFFDEKKLQEQLICAYMPGIAVKKDEFKTIPFLTNPMDVGGFVSWNTFKRRYKTKKYKDWYKGSAVINPVTWDLSNYAKRSHHKGFLFWDEKMYEQSFKTHLVDGAVWISIPHVPFRSLSVAMKDYHIGDVNLFWEDIRINAKDRVNAFKQKELAKRINN